MHAVIRKRRYGDTDRLVGREETTLLLISMNFHVCFEYISNAVLTIHTAQSGAEMLILQQPSVGHTRLNEQNQYGSSTCDYILKVQNSIKVSVFK